MAKTALDQRETKGLWSETGESDEFSSLQRFQGLIDAVVKSNLIRNLKKGVKSTAKEDVWVGDNSLSSLFPRLYRLSRAKDVVIADVVSMDSNSLSWNLFLSRNLNDREFDEMSLLDTIQNVLIYPSSCDRRLWKCHSSLSFSSKSFFDSLRKDDSVPVFNPARMIWKAIVPLKVKILAWSTAHKRTNTNDWVQRKRPFVCLSPQWCVLCKKEGEFVDHLFLHCDISIALWQRLFNLANLSWVRPSYSLLEVEFRGFGRSKRAKVLWSSVVLAIFWVIWIERNSRIFRDLVEEMDVLASLLDFLSNLYSSL
ncbi:hypothetical protein L1049_014598 [Liquidambar formosana]|uniref:Reverse transcriptase zinc-binding domain-containing protein n=1 Tax=Liquidambar formosana TaxID=63359 RepID=A0AAP0RXF8_LIQFO